MSTRNFYPDVFPGTRIDFSNSTILPGSVEFGRASVGTYIDQNGIIRTALPGEPRFTYDAATGESLGLLVEEARTNEIYNSDAKTYQTGQPFTTVGNIWQSCSNPTQGIITNITPTTEVGPDGLSGVTKISPNVGISYAFNDFTVRDGFQIGFLYTGNNKAITGFFKPSGCDVLNVRWGNYSTNRAVYTFDTSTLSVTGSDASITPVANGWFKFTMTNRTNQSLTFGCSNSNGNPNNGTDGVLIWGVQSEDNASFPTSYIPTTTSTVTRAADTFSAPVGSFKSSRIIFSPANTSTSNSVSSPTLTFSDSSSPTPPYSLELSTPSLIPTLVTKYNSVPQSYLSIPTAPAPSSPPPEQCSIAFNYNSATGAMGLATSAGDDASTTAVVLPEEYNIPAPAGYALDTVSVSGSGVLKEIYTWNTELDADQLASVAKEFKAVGRPAFTSSGLQDDTLYDVAGARPTLDLNFAKTKDLTNSVNDLSLVSFSRASKGTYVDEDGIIQEAVTDEPRFDHDPDTLGSLGLLVEEERTNSIEYSQYANQWGQFGTTDAIRVPNAAIAPDGTFTATDYSVTARYARVLNLPFTQTNSSTLSIFIKPTGGDSFTLGSLAFNTAGLGTYTFSTNTWSGSGLPQLAGYGIKEYANGWYRLWVTTANISITNTLFIRCDDDITNTSLAYVWGVQFETGTFPTSYIPTPATFISRASSATYYDSSGIIQTALTDVARDNAYFPDENGIFRPAGLLLEAVGTNLLTYSEQVDQWPQNTAVTITPNVAISPDGSLTADRFQEDVANNRHQIRQTATSNYIAGGVYCLTVFAKSGANDQVFIYFASANFSFGQVLFDLTNLTYSIIGAGTSAKITSFPNGWKKLEVTATATATGTTIPIHIGRNDTFQVGDPSRDFYIWGAQLEESPYPTSYIPTDGTIGGATRNPDTSSSAEVIRREDVAEITGTNFSSWYNQTEGTLFAEASPGSVVNPYVVEILVSTSDFVYLSLRDNFSQFQANALGATVVKMAAGPTTAGTMYKIAGGIENNNFGLSLNGSTVVLDTTPPWPGANLTSANIGRSEFSDQRYLNGTISRLTYWPNRLPDSSLQAITDPVIETWDLVFDSSLSTSGKCAITTASTCEYNVDWGDGTPAQTISASGTFTAAHTYVVPKKYNVRIEVVSGAFRPYYNNSGYADQLVEIGPSPDGWTNTSTSGFGTNLQKAWYGANNLKVVDRELNTSGVTDFQSAWYSCSSLTSFPLIDTSSGTNFNSTWVSCTSLTNFPLLNTSLGTIFTYAWQNCTSLTSLPSLDFSSGTDFVSAWRNCTSLTSFPLINTSSGTIFLNAWRGCSNLTNFPLLNTSLGTNFSYAWQNCTSLTSLPSLDFSSGTIFSYAWQNTSSLTYFPPNMFDTTGTLVSGAFSVSWTGGALSAQSIENILVSLDTNGQSGITLGINGGTNAPKSTWSTAANTAYNNLIAKGWTISFNP